MKKYSLLLTFICVLFLGVQSATAQDNSPELKAKNKTIALEKLLELTTPQVKQVYEIYLAYEKKEGNGDISELQLLRKKIGAVLQPAQKVEFDKSNEKDRMREKKIIGAGEQ